jgi:transcriptional regulator with XRE-family HTH domain
MTLGERIRRAARLRGMQDGELAAAAGVSQSGLSKIMNDHVVPRFNTLEAIVKALRLTMSEFFELEEEATLDRARFLVREGTAEGPSFDRRKAAPDLPAEKVSDELLARAIRIALRLLRENPDLSE